MSSACERCGAAFEPAESWHRSCWACWRKDRDVEQRTAAYDDGDGYRAASRTALDGQLLRDAIGLCHPDRHPAERADQATRATAGLLSLRESTRTPA